MLAPVVVLLLAALCAAAPSAPAVGPGDEGQSTLQTLTLLPDTAASAPGQSVSFRASLQGREATPVVWSTQRISGAGTFTLLASGPTTLTLRAGSGGGGSVSVVATLNTRSARRRAAQRRCCPPQSAALVTVRRLSSALLSARIRLPSCFSACSPGPAGFPSSREYYSVRVALAAVSPAAQNDPAQCLIPRRFALPAPRGGFCQRRR